jgi:copper chaperone NosL
MLMICKTTRNIKRILSLALLGSLILLAACGQLEFAPVPINPEDMCSMCRMAISEKQYSAEFITKDGVAMKFDDIGCLLDYLKAKTDRDQIAAYLVADYESKEWLKAEAAHFVKSAEFATPMGGHIAAFQNQAQAKDAAAKFKGQQLSFADLFGK